jgi:hypothetical protein
VPTPSTLDDATVALIESDPEIRDAVREMVLLSTRQFAHTLKWGSPDARLSAMKAIVPGLMRGMARLEQTEDDKELAEEFARLRSALQVR